MKVPPYLKKSCLCHDGADTSLVDQVVGAPIHLNSWELDNSHIYQDANECLHFISRNRTPLPFVLAGLGCNLLLMLPVGFSDKELPHIICKHFCKNCTFLTVCRITLCWPRRWFSKWPVCWCNVISRPLNWGILWMAARPTLARPHPRPIPQPLPQPLPWPRPLRRRLCLLA